MRRMWCRVGRCRRLSTRCRARFGRPVLLMLSCCHCERAPDGAEPPDGRVDTASESGDAPGDAAQDVADDRDGSPSACAIGVSAEPIPDEFQPDAQRLPGLPPEVDVFRIPPPSYGLEWTQCGAGCLELSEQWASQGVREQTIGGVRQDGPWLALRYGPPSGQVHTLITPVEGPPDGAFVEAQVTGTRNTGFSNPNLVASDAYLFTAYRKGFRAALALDGVGDAAVVRCLADDLEAAATYAAMQPSWYALAWSGSFLRAGRRPFDGQAPRKLSTEPYAALSDLTGTSDAIIALGYGPGDAYRLFVLDDFSGSTPGRPLFPAVDGTTVGDCCARVDGTSVAWLRGGDHQYSDAGYAFWGTVDLMRGDISSSGKVSNPVKVRSVPVQVLADAGGFGGGYYVGFGSDTFQGPELVYVVRVSDGRMWKIAARSANVLWARVLYVTADEIALVERYAVAAPTASQIVRYAVADLGPGE